MTTRQKTIEYSVQTNTATLAAATRRDSASQTIYIAETASRVFRSVVLEVTLRGDETVAASMTSNLIGIKLGAAAFSDATQTITFTNTGDPQSFILTRDVTSYFTTNFGAGGSQTMQVGLQFGALITANHGVRLLITYDYDDASATTRTRTVRIPLESGTGLLTNALASIGTNQIPALDTFLPEASKVYRQIVIEAVGNDSGSGTVDFSLAIDLTGGTTLAEVSIWRSEAALNGSTFYRAFYDLTSALVTGSTANLRARSNAVTNMFSCPGFIVRVTYEYNHSTSTRVMNSLFIPAADELGFPGNTTAADKSRFERVVWIQEPGTITLAQSGLVCVIQDPANLTLNVLCGSQTTRAYVLTGGSVTSGPFAFTHRIDSGSAGGAFGTLARGRNTINVDRFTTVTNIGSNFSAMMLLNYTSDIHANGDGVHAHSVCYSIVDTTNTNAQQRNIAAPNQLFAFPESSYYVSGFMVDVAGVSIGASASAITVQAELLAGESPGAGWVDVVSAMWRADAEFGAFWTSGAPRDYFIRWPSDPDTSRMVYETTRQWRICTLTLTNLSVRGWVTYHAITYAIAGTVSGSSGGTVDITAHRSATGEKIGSTSRTGNGAFSMTWYDNTENVYTVARESSTLLARSDDGLAA